MSLDCRCIIAQCRRTHGNECAVCLDPAYQWRKGECWVLANLRRAGKSDKEIEAEMKRYAATGGGI